MKIGMLSTPWLPTPPVGYGGLELVVDHLTRALVDLGHEVVLFATGDSTTPVERRWSIDVAQRERMGIVTIEARHVVDAYDALVDCEVIHDHTLIGPLTHSKVPVVTTIHGEFDQWLTSPFRHIAERMPLVCISETQRQTAPAVKVHRVIHHGLDITDYPMGDGLGGYALFLGRMSPQKGVDAAVRACTLAGVPLKIAAKMQEPEEYEYYEKKVRPLLHDEAEYLGEVSKAEVATLLGDAICLVNPTTHVEPFGMVMIEALACGTPVLASNKGACVEIVTDGANGLLSSDETQLVDNLRRVRSIRRQLCRDTVETGYFSARRMAEEYAQVYENAM